MAQAKTDSTTIDDATSKTSSNWLSIIEDVFLQWRDRLGSSREAVSKLRDLLCDPETISMIRRVDGSGEEFTRGYGDAEFWQHRLLLVPDINGGLEHLEVNYGDALLDFHDPDGHWEFYVRRLDVELWESRYPELAASAPTTVGAETRATEHLKPLLECNNAMSKAEARQACKQFKLSGTGFDDRVWPAARIAAGLPAVAPPGRKRRK